MKFWDSSAIVPLYLKEAHSATVGEILASDREMYVWWGRRTECTSALMRRSREVGTTTEEVGSSRLVLTSLSQSWTELGPSESIRNRADQLLALHVLRAADAFQLAAAVEWCEGLTSGLGFVTLDRRLREAGHREGFSVLPEAI